tara:strand:+ start:1240 stop:1428 length:189 start_codon:yes stop_codon:yes gene_type:complete
MVFFVTFRLPYFLPPIDEIDLLLNKDEVPVLPVVTAPDISSIVNHLLLEEDATCVSAVPIGL